MDIQKIKVAAVAVLGVALASVVYYCIVFSPSQEVPPVELRASGNELAAIRSYWEEEIRTLGPEAAYANFKERTQENASSSPHTLVHLFGEALYNREGLEGIRICDESFEFGCYHSFFGVAIEEHGVGILPEFDLACKNTYGRKYMPCQHGIGHGVLVYTGYENLNEALALCESISPENMGGCSSGVFMEYNFHTMEQSEGGTFLREMTENLYEPCDALPHEYQPSCYYEQVQWWEEQFDEDWEHISSLCNEIEGNETNTTTCFNGIGNYVASASSFDYETVREKCSLMPDEEKRGFCHEGASWLMVANPEYMDDAQKLCSDLEEPFGTVCSKKLQPQLID